MGHTEILIYLLAMVFILIMVVRYWKTGRKD